MVKQAAIFSWVEQETTGCSEGMDQTYCMVKQAAIGSWVEPIMTPFTEVLDKIH